MAYLSLNQQKHHRLVRRIDVTFQMRFGNETTFTPLPKLRFLFYFFNQSSEAHLR